MGVSILSFLWRHRVWFQQSSKTLFSKKSDFPCWLCYFNMLNLNCAERGHVKSSKALHFFSKLCHHQPQPPPQFLTRLYRTEEDYRFSFFDIIAKTNIFKVNAHSIWEIYISLIEKYHHHGITKNDLLCKSKFVTYFCTRYRNPKAVCINQTYCLYQIYPVATNCSGTLCLLYLKR